MTREDILKAYLKDDLFLEKGYLNQHQVDTIKFSETSPNKLVEVIKKTIEATVKGDFDDSSVARALNNYLNK
ncbi:hypothetical protein [Flaviaesturariibacter terrae]